MAYSPASVATGTAGVNHLATVWYDRIGVKNFKANLPFYDACEQRTLPNYNGKTIQLYGYNLMAANITPGTEGTVGTGIAPGTTTQQATLAQYFDFESFSDLLVETAIDPIVENAAVELGYRAALTVNTLVSAQFDTAVASDSAAAINLADNEFFNAAVARQMVLSLQGKDVRPKASGKFAGRFAGILHPFVAYDLINDNTAGGVQDTLKYTDAGREQLERGIQGDQVMDLCGARWVVTTTVPTTANFPSSGKTGFSTYLVGQDAIFTVGLGKTQVPNQKNFRVKVNNNLADSAADPAGVIGAIAAYNFKFAVTQRPGSVMALRRVKSEASIS